MTKLERNVERDRQHDEVLRRHGWAVMRVWEHEDVGDATRRVERLVRTRRGGASA